METTRLIEEYLDDTLPPAERAAIESRAATDSDFRKLILLHREVNESIRDKELAQLKRLTDKISSEMFPPQTKTRRINYHFLRIAAIFIFIAGAAALIKISFFDSNGAQRIYNDYYLPYESDAVSRSLAAEEESLDQAITFYSHEKYAEAIAVLNVVIQEDRLNYMAWFYKGLASLEINDPVQSISSFKAIPEAWNSLFREHRNWYLALALLKNNSLDEARARFTGIQNERGYYSDRSAEILSKLPD